jgi:hypothetical protein
MARISSLCVLSGVLSICVYGCAVDAPPEPSTLAEASQAQVRPAALVFGRISTWCGKVNVHAPLGGGWESDSDCVSGCNLDPLEYCQKFWPDTGFVIEAFPSDKPVGLWNNRGCVTVFDNYVGDTEFLCVP